MNNGGAWFFDGVNLVEEGVLRDLGKGELEVFLEVIWEHVSKSGLEDKLEGELEVLSLFSILANLSEVRKANILNERSSSREFLGNENKSKIVSSGNVI